MAFSPSKYWADLLANRKQHAPRGAQWMPFLPLSALLIKLNLGKFFYVHINFSSPCRIWSLQNKIRWLKHKHLIKYLQIWSATVERHHNIQSSADTWKLWAEIEMMQLRATPHHRWKHLTRICYLIPLVHLIFVTTFFHVIRFYMHLRVLGGR